MPRLQVYLPDDLHAELKARGLPASELLQGAVRAELARRRSIEEADRYLEDLEDEVGPSRPDEIERAEAIARRIRVRALDNAS